MCIQKTDDGIFFPIQCTLITVAIIVVPLLYIGSEQLNNICLLANYEVYIYAEHLDYILDIEEVNQTIMLLDNLNDRMIHTQTIILYISPNIVSNHVWASVLNKIIDQNLVHLLCIDEYHYITSASIFV